METDCSAGEMLLAARRITLGQAMTSPLLMNFPDRIQSLRLLIRAPRWGDGAALNAAVCESMAELQPWMPWAQHAPTPQDSEETVRRAHLKYWAREDFMLQLWLRDLDSGRETVLIGGSGLHRPNWDVPSFEIGYWCRTAYAGRGYVSEAVRAISRLAFEHAGAQRVFIRCDARNERSRQVAQACGFQLEAHLRHDSRATDGSLRDTLSFSLLREEWEAQQ